jgi:hypothetical protein
VDPHSNLDRHLLRPGIPEQRKPRAERRIHPRGRISEGEHETDSDAIHEMAAGAFDGVHDHRGLRVEDGAATAPALACSRVEPTTSV